uniref:O1_Vc6.37 prepropeptide n=1 Tax=Conus victoriae TaxID=319920 RepID=W4VSF7_CONVC
MKVSSVLIVAMLTLTAGQLISASSHYSEDVQISPSVRSADEVENSENVKLSKRKCMEQGTYCSLILFSSSCCGDLCLFGFCIL